MEQDDHAFKPQWLMQGAGKAAGAASIFARPSARPDNQAKGGSSRNHSSGRDNSRQSSSRKGSGSNGSRQPDQDGMGKSRGYANFGRNREKDQDKDFNSRGRESRVVPADRDGFQSFSTCRSERDRLNHARLKADARNKGVAISLNNDSTSRSNDVVSFSKRNDVVTTSESSTPASTAAVSTSLSKASVSTSIRKASVNTLASTAADSVSVSIAVDASRSIAADASRSTAADSSRCNAALSSSSRSNTALGTSRSNSALSNSRSSAALSTPTRSNSALSTPRSNSALSTPRSNAALSTPRNYPVVNTPRSNAAGMDFEREFPQLSLEDNNGRQGITRVPSPGINTPIQNIPLINAPDGWNSVLADLSLLKDAKKSQAASSALQTASKQIEAVSNSVTALSMAETVIQGPPRISIGPQLSVEAQKIEERTLRQYTLRPLTPPASKSSVLSSSKTKTAKLGDPTGPSKTVQQLKMHSANGSVRTPVKIDVSKLSQSGSLQVLSREQNGTVHTSKDYSSPVSPPAPSVSMEPHKRTVSSQKSKIAPHELSLSLQGSCGDRKSNARDKRRFFESLRKKSPNDSNTGTALETGCQQFPSSLVDVKHDSSLNIGNDQSLFPTGAKCMANGKCSCEEIKSSEGSHRHLTDNEENNSSMKTDVADGVPQQLEKGEDDSSSERADIGDEEFQLSFSDSGAEGSSFSAPADSDNGFNRSQSGSEETSSSSEAMEPEDDEYPAEPPPEDKSFLISLGWREDEVVQPLGLDEIVDSVKGCAELEKKLSSMESNANVRIILNILGRAK